MVNMDKWEEIDFFDAKVGDTVKRVEVSNLTITETKGKVTQTEFGDTYNGTVYRTGYRYGSALGYITIFQDGKTEILRRDFDGPPAGVKVYRRRKEFVFPLNSGAVVTGYWVKNGYRATLVRVNDDWVSLAGNGHYTETDLRASLKNITVVSSGVVVL